MHLYSESFVRELTRERKKLVVKTLHDAHTGPSRIIRHSTGQFEIVKFDEENVSHNKRVLNTLQKITEYVDLELGNNGVELSFDNEYQVVYIMWMPARHLVIGYLSIDKFNESYKSVSYTHLTLPTIYSV